MRIRGVTAGIRAGAATALSILSVFSGIGLASAVADETDGAQATTASTAAATSVLPPDSGVTIPSKPNEAVGDVLGVGYEQVVRINGSSVEIAEPASRGGAVKASFVVQALAQAPRDNLRYAYGVEQLLEETAHDLSRIEVLNDSIYVSAMLPMTYGAGTVGPGGGIVVKLSASGEVLNERRITNPTNVMVTSLDAYEFKGHEYLAIGLNKFGIRVVDTKVDDMPDVRVVHDDWNGRNGLWHRDMVTAVKLGVDSEGRFVLISGRFTYEGHAVVATDLEDGSTSGSDRAVHDIWTNNDRPLSKRWQWPNLIEMGAFGPDKQPMVAIGWPTTDHDENVGRVSFVHADDGKDWHWTDGTEPGAVRFFTDAEGEPRVAILRGVAVIGGVNASGGWEEVAQIPEEQELPWAVPGYRAWTVTIENRSRDDVTFRPYSGATQLDGCWWRSELRASPSPMPTQPTTIKAGSASAPYATAQRLFGGGCGQGHPGVFYAQVAPDGSPEEAQIAKFLGDKDGVRIEQQVGGGRLAIATERVGATGITLIVSDRHAEPSPVGVPTITASRLTPEPAAGLTPTDDPDDPFRPVHRFTVSGQTWHVPGAGQLANVTLPVPTVEASTDQVTWTALGTTTSPLAPSRTGTEITLGDSTFLWQTAPGAADYRYFRVTLPDGTTSEQFDVSTLTAPAAAPPKTAGDLVVTGGGALRPNGLDQAPFRLSVMNDTSHEYIRRALDPASYPELYDRVYFRNDDDSLITGLGNASAPVDLMLMSHDGQFAPSMMGAFASDSVPLNISMTSQRPVDSVWAVLRADGSATGVKDGKIVPPITPTNTTLVADGVAGSSLSVATCAEGACTIVEPTATEPVLHSLDQRSISMQLSNQARHGAASLPLTNPNAYPETIDLVTDEFVYATSRASLLNPNRFGFNATITAQFVTHGELVTAESIYVKEKE